MLRDHWTLARTSVDMRIQQQALLKAKAEGRALTREGGNLGAPTNLRAPDAITGRVFLPIDPGCASGRVGFAEFVLRLPELVEIGGPAGADAVYIDGKALWLSSGLTSGRSEISWTAGEMTRRDRAMGEVAAAAGRVRTDHCGKQHAPCRHQRSTPTRLYRCSATIVGHPFVTCSLL